MPKWSAEEDAELLRLKAAGWSNAQIARTLGRTLRACACRAAMFNRGEGRMTKTAAAPWTKEDDAWLLESYRKYGAKACAEKLGRTAESVRTHFRRIRRFLPRDGMDEREREPEPVKPRMRRCHDCGCLTPDFRCPACWERIRTVYDYSFEDDPED